MESAKSPMGQSCHERKLWPVSIATENDLNYGVTVATSVFDKWSKQMIHMRKDAVQSFLLEFFKYKDESTTLLTRGGENSDLNLT